MTKLTKLGARRLLKLATILDTADALHKRRKEPTYDQTKWWSHSTKRIRGTTVSCATPACALGHYAANTRGRGWGWSESHGMTFPGMSQSYAAEQEFGLDYAGYLELFDEFGCNEAKTAKQAAKYIRSFVARKGVA